MVRGRRCLGCVFLLVLAGLRRHAAAQEISCTPHALASQTQLINAVCCDEPSENCTTGAPAVCNVGCAEVFLPFMQDCGAALGAESAHFVPVVALCEAAALTLQPVAPESHRRPGGGHISAVPARGVIFFLDLESGPPGSLVTMYGTGFGSHPGVVTVGGLPATSVLWTDTKVAIVVPALPFGATPVLLEGSLSTAQFVVRAGRLFFVATTGNDNANGSVATPWATLLHARDSIQPGDIVYARNGVSQSTDDGQGWSTCFLLATSKDAGTPGMPKAIVAYPGETVTIGNVNGTAAGGCNSGIRTKGRGEDYWTFAGLVLRGGIEAATTFDNQHWRLVGNDMSCPNGNGQTGCFIPSGSGNSHNFTVFGNIIHHVATNLPPSKVTTEYHGVYISETQADLVWD